MINHNAIFLPSLALIGWTMTVLLLIPFQRFKAGLAKQVDFEDFKNGESDKVPAYVRIPNRNFMNLLEVPVLFYVLSLVSFLTHAVDIWLLLLSWLYVALRVVHSLIHLSYNKVLHRLLVFALSNFVLATLLIKLSIFLI